MNRVLKFIILFFAVLILQFFIFDKLYLIGLPNIYVYIFFILILPYNFNQILTLFISFALGFIIDVFNITPGLHALAALTIGYLRLKFLELYSGGKEYDCSVELEHRKYGWIWFFKYYGSIILIHNTIVIIISYFSFANFFELIYKIIISSLFSLFFIILIYSLFLKK